MIAARVHWLLVLVLVAASTCSVAIGQIALGVLLSWFLVDLARRRASLPRLGVEIAVLAFFGWAVVMVPLSEDPERSFEGLKRFYLFTAMWIVARAVTDEARRQTLALVLVVASALVGVVGTLIWVRGPERLFVHRLDVVSNAMTSGALFMMAALVGMAGALRPGVPAPVRRLVGCAGALCVLSLAATMTRSALLGFVAGAAVLVMVRAPRRARIVLVSAAMVLGLLVFEGGRFLPDRLASRFAAEELAGGRNTIARLDMWRAGLNMVQERPWTGFGDVSLGELSMPYYPDPPVRVHGHMHNDLVQIAVIWGLPGLALYLVFSARRLVVLGRRRVETPWADVWRSAALATLVGFFVAGFTEWYFGDAEPLLLSMIVFGVGVARDDGPTDSG